MTWNFRPGTIYEFEFQVFLKVQLEGRIIGSVRTYLKNGTGHIGKLIVHPDHQNKSMGTRLLQAAEKLYPDAKRYELYTGEKSQRNLHLYQKNGYKIFGSKMVSDKLTLVLLEKCKSIPLGRWKKGFKNEISLRRYS